MLTRVASENPAAQPGVGGAEARARSTKPRRVAVLDARTDVTGSRERLSPSWMRLTIQKPDRNLPTTFFPGCCSPVGSELLTTVTDVSFEEKGGEPHWNHPSPTCLSAAASTFPSGHLASLP